MGFEPAPYARKVSMVSTWPYPGIPSYIWNKIFTFVLVNILTLKNIFHRVHRTLNHTRKFGSGQCSLVA